MIRNYPGFPHGISGHDLTRRACEQAWMFGAHIVFSQPTVGLECRGDERIVHLADGHQIAARAVILRHGHRLAPPRRGAASRRWSAPESSTVRPGARRGRWRAATCSSSARATRPGQTALHLARYARQVTLVVRGDDLARPMSDYLIREIEATPNIAVRLNTEVIDGDGTRSPRPGSPCTTACHDRTEQVPAAALFVLIGGEPRTQWLPDTIQLERGYIRPGATWYATGPCRPVGRSIAPRSRSRPRARRVRGRRRPLPFDQAGRVRRRRRRDRGPPRPRVPGRRVLRRHPAPGPPLTRTAGPPAGAGGDQVPGFFMASWRPR